MGVVLKVFRNLFLPEGTHPYWGFVLAAGLFLVGLLSLAASVSESVPFPDASKALRVSGEIRDLKAHLWETTFRMSGRLELFVYPAKMGELGSVTAALETAKNLDVLAVPRHRNQVSDEPNDKRLEVISIVADGKIVRSVTKSNASWDQDNEMLKWIAGPAVAILFWFIAYIAFQVGLGELNRRSR